MKIHSRHTFDGLGRLTSITHGKTEIAAGQNWSGTSAVPASLGTTNMLAAYSLTYDTDNRVTALASWRDAFSTAYTYNTTDQLTAAVSTAIAGMTLPNPLPAAESYNLDANGNRRTATGVSQSAAGTHNRLQTDGTFNYIYDNEGNVTRRTRIVGGQVTDYTWDHRNRLTSVTERVSATGAVTKRTELVYDLFNQRVGKRLDIGTIGTWDRYEEYIWADGQEVLRMVDSDGQGAAQPFRLTNRYLWGPAVDQLLADEQYAAGAGPAVGATTASTATGANYWALTDHLGSVRDLVDNNGVVREHNVYDSFGRLVREVDYNAAGAVIASTDPAAVDTLFGYTARDFDADVGLQYNRARWYDATNGRWLSQDPIGFAAGDANLYRYVGNKVTGATDPDGLQKKSLWEQKARDAIGFKPGSPSHPRDIIEMNKRITAAYAEMYLKDPSKFIWAGMAALASCDVGEGMRKARELRNVAGEPLIAMGTLVLGAPTGTELLQALGKGNLGVYADLYWQHLAYTQRGIEEIRSLAANGELSDSQLAAWEDVDSGDVWAGNRALLLYEQQQTLQKGVYDQHQKAFSNMSWLAGYYPAAFKSPIPGDDMMFTQCVPGGNLGNFDDRWKWIDTSMLPAWRALVESNPAKIKSMMEEFLKNKFPKP